MNKLKEHPADMAVGGNSGCSDTRCCPPSTPVTRDQPKVGRNDPCPCESGQKFKKCCGR